MHTDPSSADTVTGPFVEGAVPDHTAQIRTHFDLRKSLALDAAAYEVSQLDNQGPLSNVTIPAYTRLDVGLTWKPWEQTILQPGGSESIARPSSGIRRRERSAAIQPDPAQRLRESDLEILGAMKTKRDCEIRAHRNTAIAAAFTLHCDSPGPDVLHPPCEPRAGTCAGCSLGISGQGRLPVQFSQVRGVAR